MTAGKFKFVKAEDTPLTERKKVLRADMKKRRAEVCNRDVKARLAVEQFFAAGLGDKDKYFVYISFSSELSTELLIAELIKRKKQVFCPRVEKDGMVAVAYTQDCTLSDFGVREPVGEPYLGQMDVCVCPLIAVDEQGARLGFGGGYYDKFLARQKDAALVGWCFEMQVINAVPSEPHDIKMQYIATERGVRTIERKTEGN